MTRNRTPSGESDVDAAVETVRANARPLSADALDALVDRLADARYVLLGEATHGTSEFYRLRARLSARLLREEGFSFVAVEGDWTDCYGVNRFAKGATDHEGADEALAEFDRWPTWMWANWEVVEFVDWLADYNRGRPDGEKAGFFGLDVYSLFESMAEVVDYLRELDPEIAERARGAYRCFEPYGEDPQEYARSTRLVPESCEDEVVDILAELREREPEFDSERRDDYFNAEQNALVAKNAERYYRTMVRGGSSSWNVRDRHMVETLERLMDHHGPDAGGIVWAHNTHVGDARATSMADRGEVNVGQLVRENNAADEVAVVGFGGHRGSVVAADEWGAEMEAMELPRAKEGSYEDVFHRADAGDSLLVFDEVDDVDPLAETRGHRAVGVVYNPERERGNYVSTELSDRYDAFVHFEETEALHAFRDEAGATEPETYPWGL